MRTPKKRRSVSNKWSFLKTTYLFLPVKMKRRIKKSVLTLAKPLKKLRVLTTKVRKMKSTPLLK
jgi:hypothetical protein